MRMEYLKITANGLRRHQKSQILKDVQALGWSFVEESNDEDIHTINRRIQIPGYLPEGKQNPQVHQWGPLCVLNLNVEYAGSNGLQV
jgi:hypothetical protein